MANGLMSTRVTGFLNYLDDAIANITLDVTPKLTTRQRQNASQASVKPLRRDSVIDLTLEVISQEPQRSVGAHPADDENKLGAGVAAQMHAAV